MNLRARRGETVDWSNWVNGRYQGVRVKGRAGIHLSLSGRSTLCMRRVDRNAPVEPEHRDRLCATCRATSMAAYRMAHPRARGGAAVSLTLGRCSP